MTVFGSRLTQETTTRVLMHIVLGKFLVKTNKKENRKEVLTTNAQ